MWGSWGPVPGARVAANPRLLSCKYHTHRNVGRKEDLEGARPGQVCSRSPGPPLSEPSTDDQVVLYCLSLGHVEAQNNTQCTVHLLHLRTNHTHTRHDFGFWSHLTDVGELRNNINECAGTVKCYFIILLPMRRPCSLDQYVQGYMELGYFQCAAFCLQIT